MTLDQILNLAERLAIYGGFSTPTVDVTILPMEAEFLSKILKSTIGGNMPCIPAGAGWVKGWPPENPKIGDEIIFLDGDGDVDKAEYVDGYSDDGKPAWEGRNIDPTGNVLCWRPFDAPV